eukprot:5316216-Alexandrium_andersonii.AAC.2
MRHHRRAAARAALLGRSVNWRLLRSHTWVGPLFGGALSKSLRGQRALATWGSRSGCEAPHP